MSYLLDTNIVSDIAKRKDAGLLRWTEQPSPRRPKLEAWLQHDLPAQFSGRLLAVTQGVALAYGELAAQARRGGRPLPVIDGLLLATARTHRLTLVTRNVDHIEGRGVPVLDPYTGGRPKH